MNKSIPAFIKGLKRKAKIVLILAVTVLLIGGILTAVLLDSPHMSNKNNIPTIPITLSYYPEEAEVLIDKYEKHSYVFHQRAWESWKTPGVDVTLRLNKDGDIEIRECRAFIASSEETSLPRFVATGQNVVIDGNQINVTIAGYLDYGSYRSDEQTVEFKVRFFAVLDGLNSSKPKEI